MRVAFLANLAPRKQGSFERWLVALALELRRRGHEVAVFSHEPVHDAVRAGLESARADWAPIRGLLDHGARAVARLRRFDVLHVNLYGLHRKIPLLGRLAWPARVLVTDRTSEDPAEAYVATPLRRVRDRFLPTRIAAVAGVSDYVRDRNAARFGLSWPRVRTIYNGVDVERFRPPEPPRPRSDDVHIMGAANLIPVKGLDLLVSAVGALGDRRLRLSIVGDGPEADRLRALGASLGLGDRLQMLGLRNDLDQLLRTVDIFAHPMRWAEAFGLTVAEAMASGCPVVAARAGSIPELVTDGETGLLVPTGDVPALAAALGRLVGDAPLRARLGAAGRARAVERFSLAECVRRHADWCEEFGPGYAGPRGRE